MDRRFNVGDIVVINAAGMREHAYGYEGGKLEVVALIGSIYGEPAVSVRFVNLPGSICARWREKWYDAVEQVGPW